MQAIPGYKKAAGVIPTAGKSLSSFYIKIAVFQNYIYGIPRAAAAFSTSEASTQIKDPNTAPTAIASIE